ncbi:MAG TPA: hypothetical protein VFG84_01935 [Gemmatimonadaceae bacterium]|nr:hypothetical protein [Gemmatimonadaceae bacterium]
MSRRLQATVAALALVAVPAVMQAQTSRAHIGPRFSYNFDVEDAAIGVQFGLPVADRTEFYPSFDVYFVNPGSLWALNADLKYRLTPDVAGWWYVGGGLSIAHASVGDADDTNAGLNLLTGVESLSGWVHPFAEGRVTLSDDTNFQLSLGLNFTIGRH